MYNLYTTESFLRMIHKIIGKVWIHPGAGGWHFVTLPKKSSEDIKKRFQAVSKGWGSLPVMATLGRTSWKTSIFPDKKSAGYLLPIKAEVRKKEAVKAGETLKIRLTIIV